MKPKKTIKSGLFQAMGVATYCLGVGLIFWRGNRWLGSPGYLGPVIVLILFVVSALIYALIVFYQPYNLFFAGKKKEALDLVLTTTLWLFVILIVFLLSTAFCF